MTRPDFVPRSCPCCGADVARLLVTVDGCRVLCDPEKGGCGAEGGPGQCPDDAIEIWNGWAGFIGTFREVVHGELTP